jgi:choline dehydrogenase-like flavoprotein
MDDAAEARTPEDARRSDAISRRFEHLVERIDRRYAEGASPTACHFDVVIVGSGYGAAIAAEEFSRSVDGEGKMPTICVLERGNEYLAGSFPTQMSDLAGYVRFASGESAARGQADGLFDIRVGKDLSAVVANGVGGGSLINAGVLAEPRGEVFADARWPSAIRNDQNRAAYYKEAMQRLQAESTAGIAAGGGPWLKTEALKRLNRGQHGFSPLWITVALPGQPQPASSPFKTCIGCGDCATGCNFGAKKSVDATLLSQAHARGVEIYSGATVRELFRDERNDRWGVVTLYTDELLRARRGKCVVINAKQVILCAGTFGSTEILLRSRLRPKGPRVSGRLGEGFSANGDMLAAAYGLKDTVNALADPTVAFRDRKVGPTITAMLDKRTGDPRSDVVVQDLGVPGPLRKAFEECFAMAKTFHDLPRIECGFMGPGKKDPCAIDRKAFDSTLPVALIAHDAAAGRLRMPTPDGDEPSGEGVLIVDWPEVGTDPRRDGSQQTFERIVEDSGQGGVAYANPVWRPLPAELGTIFGQPRGPLLTVHPLGGCAMGEDISSGVVDHLGRVFDPLDARTQRHGGVHPGLAVLDGSIVPMSLGINPSLTIAALAVRAAQALATEWGYRTGSAPTSQSTPARPILRDVPDPKPPIATEVELLERVRGPIKLRGHPGDYVLELTLCFQPMPIAQLGVESGAATAGTPSSFVLDRERSWMRIRNTPTGIEEPATFVQARLEGSLDVLTQERSIGLGRLLRGVVSWVSRRALRDGIQNLRGRRAGLDLPAVDVAKHWRSIAGVCAHAGEARRLDYRLKVVGNVECARGFEDARQFAGGRIHTHKRLTYGAGLFLGLLSLWKQSACNPLLQLSRMHVTRFPGLAWSSRHPTLELHLPFLVERRSPLLRITQQQDHPAALADLMSFVLYAARILIREHALTFRKPDDPPPPTSSRLPGEVPGLPPPIIVELCSGTIPEDDGEFRRGDPVMIRLTRYCPSNGAGGHPPILLVHGYSASGTTFAHRSLPCSLARHLVDESRDVWILDLRSSAGMPTARYPWSFEAIGFADFPVAVDHVCRATGKDKIDVFAHCMGAAMLSMALLGDFDDPPLAHDTHPVLRRRLPHRIAHLVFSQIGPALLLSPANLYRAYLLSYVKNFLPTTAYRFRPTPGPEYGKADGLLDRLLVALPYDDREFRRENPFWPLGKYVRWSGIRHRIDILYGQVFELAKMADSTLDALDDFFGPLNFDTVAQVIHFAGIGCIADRTGQNRYVTPDRMARAFIFPVLSIHGEKNGLADIETLNHMEDLFTGFHRASTFERRAIPGYGHQDCLMGIDARARVFDLVSSFLDGRSCPTLKASPATNPRQAPSAPSGSIKVVWPSRGARIDGSSLVVDDAGGSGRPTLVAVALVDKGATAYDFAPDHTEFCELPIPADQRESPYRVALPSGLQGLLAVALVYHQVASIGPDTGRLLSVDGPTTPRDETESLRAELKDLLARSVENGPLPCLVRLPTAASRSRGQSSPARTFAFASCQYPEDLLDGSPPLTTTKPGPADASLMRLARRLGSSQHQPEFLVLTGDQVYVDATAGLFDPRRDADRFRIPYENWLGSLGMRSVLGLVPVYMMLDDHEIVNNWEPEALQSRRSVNVLRLDRGRTAYWDRQRVAGPKPFCGSRQYLWTPISAGGIDLFLADTRTRRTRRTATTLDTASILGDAMPLCPDQGRELENWLLCRRNAGRPSFVCSPALLLPRHLTLRCQGPYSVAALESDGWDGYPASLYRMLGFLCENQIGNVCFLSGDEHLGIWAEALVEKLGDSSKSAVRVRSIHTSGLYSPYPFANGKPQDFAAHDVFSFEHNGAAYRCTLLDCGFAPGDGVTYITIDQDAHGVTVIATFDRDHGQSTCRSFRL